MRFVQQLRLFFRRLFRLDGGEFLCDRCKYNHPSTCSVRGRPNVRECREFRKK